MRIVAELTDIEVKVFDLICRFEVSIMDRGYPTSSTNISELLNISLYKARKDLKSLKQKGLVQSYRYCIYDDYSESNLLLSGYRLTELAKQTETYEQAQERENEIINECITGVDYARKTDTI